MGDPRHSDAAFGQVHLATHQGPVVTETFASIVAGKHNQGVVQLSGFLKGLNDPPNAFVHVMNHALVGVNVATVQMK